MCYRVTSFKSIELAGLPKTHGRAIFRYLTWHQMKTDSPGNAEKLLQAWGLTHAEFVQKLGLTPDQVKDRVAALEGRPFHNAKHAKPSAKK